MKQCKEYLFAEKQATETEHIIKLIIDEQLHQIYGNNPDEQITLRFQEEWSAMERSNTILDVAALYELTVWLKKNGHSYWMRGCAGSSFILYLLDITVGNPLPPHYCCPVCHSVKWMPEYRDGFDLPREVHCGEDYSKLNPDGHDIPWQTLWGYDNHEPVFDIDIPDDLLDDMGNLLDNHWLNRVKDNGDSENVHIGKNSLALGQLRINCRLDRASISRGFHQKKVDSYCSTIALNAWQTLFDDYEDYSDSSIVGVDTFADLISYYGLRNTMGAWDEETIYFNRELDYAPSDLIAFRDDVYRYLVSHKFLSKDAWKGMNCVRKGLSLPVVTEEMKHSFDKWVLKRFDKIAYLFPKAHAVEYILFRLKATILPCTIQFVKTGFDGIDYAIGGINCADVIVVGGRPAMGKTSFALDVASYLAHTEGKKVTIFTSSNNLVNIRYGFEKRGLPIEDTKISICSAAALSVPMMKEKLNAEQTDLVVIDELSDFGQSRNKKATQMASIMRQIKEIAKDYHVPILLLTNLSRRIEQRIDHLPRLKDVLAYERVIPYTDSILLLYREAYYDMDASRDTTWCFVAQNRRGGLGFVPLKWDDNRNGFRN